MDVCHDDRLSFWACIYHGRFDLGGWKDVSPHVIVTLSNIRCQLCFVFDWKYIHNFVILFLICQSEEEKAELPFLKKRSSKTQKKYTDRQKTAFVDPAVEEQFVAGKLYGRLSQSALDFVTKFQTVIGFIYNSFQTRDNTRSWDPNRRSEDRQLFILWLP